MTDEQSKIPTTIAKDMIFTISRGDYSCYEVMGVFRALADINTVELLEEYLTFNPEQRADHSFREDHFLGFCYGKGLFEQIYAREWFLGDFGHHDGIELRDFGPSGIC